MSLARAITALTPDREIETGLRDVLRFLTEHENQWFESGRLASVTSLSGPRLDTVLGGLARSFVLDFHDDPPCYRYHPDTLLDIEVSRFLRRTDSRDGMMRGNLERFRSRYGGSG